MKFLHRILKTDNTTEERKQKNKQLLLALLSGVLLGISFPPVPMPFLIFFALIPYLFVLEKRESLAEINRITYFTNFFFSLITLYWVGSWTKEADPFLMISGVVLMFFNPAVYLVPSTLYYFCKKAINKKTALFLFPFFWVTFEYAYSLTDFRFPWLTLANSLPNFNIFIQIADIVGAYGISLIVLYINLFLYLSIKSIIQSKKYNYSYTFAAIILFSIPLIYGVYRINSFKVSNDKIKVGLIQPNLNPWDKWETGNINEQLNQYIDLSDKAIQHGAKLILWPESALPVYLLSGNYPFEVDRIHSFVDTNNIYLITGMPDATFYINKEKAPEDSKVSKVSGIHYVSYNSILLFAPNTWQVQKYGKIKLVPFGEHVPFVEQLPVLGDLIKWQIGISSWNVGKEQVVFDLNDKVKVGGVICIESIYPDFVAGFVQRGANLIAVVTNDSWYGYSSGPFQHKEIAALRAVENRRTVVRAANGGVSCIIDPLGRTINQTKLFTKNVLIGNTAFMNEMTFYTRYPIIIPYLASFISILTILIFFYKKYF